MELSEPPTRPVEATASKTPQQQQQKTSLRKRKRGGDDDDKAKKQQRKSKIDQWEAEQLDRYQRLVHACTKDLHKQAKVVKSFECQKVVRQLKKENEKQGSSRNEKEGEEEEEEEEDAEAMRLRKIKAFDLNIVVMEALRRLGIPNLRPQQLQKLQVPSSTSLSKETEEMQTINLQEANEQLQQHQQQQLSSTAETSTPNTTHDNRKVTSSDEEIKLMERVLQHKRMQEALEQWNDKVTEYRKWCLRKSEWAAPATTDPFASSNSDNNNNNKHKRSTKNNKKKTTSAVTKAAPGTTLFVNLGGGSLDDGISHVDDVDHDNPYAHYGPGATFDGDGDGDDNAEAKKNRPGQRARKAKAMAMQARKEGKTWDSSLNWREKKEKTQQQQALPTTKKRSDRKSERKSLIQKDRTQAASRGFKEEQQPSQEHQQHHPPKDASSQQKPEQLHPSWAAKQAQKTGIVEFKGTKITFD